MSVRVVIHAPTEAALQRARSNALNLLKEMPGAEIEIVVNADGVRAALSGEHASDGLLVFCRNTLDATGQSVTKGATVVPSAAAHLVRRQREGWIYIRA
jgi:NitT/TauT family transport system ATP-binding protein